MALFLLNAPAMTAATPALAQQAAMQFSSEPLTVTTAKGVPHAFTVEVAASDAQRERGLMFRKTMPADHGMLFDFDTVRPVMMWMENTPLPLDMLFLNGEGEVTHIRENAVPYSRTIIDSGGPVKYVIELNGGAVKKLGLAVGDHAASDTIIRNSRH